METEIKDMRPFTITLKKMKWLSISSKHVQKIYAEKHKVLMKEIKDLKIIETIVFMDC